MVKGRWKGEGWALFPRQNPGASLRVFCFPYAGGSALIYRQWPEQLPPHVEVCAVQLPGRGARIAEPAFTQVPALVRAAATALLPYMDRPFVFFGHSMGATISFELARLLRAEGGPQPLHLFVAGRRAPQVIDPSPPSYDLPEPEFIEELRRLNGTTREVLEHEELMRLMIPVLRADFSVSQTYEYVPGPPLDCPVTVYGGLRDEEVPREHLEVWGRETRTMSLRMFPGDHFFIHSDEAALLRDLSQELNRYRVTPV